MSGPDAAGGHAVALASVSAPLRVYEQALSGPAGATPAFGGGSVPPFPAGGGGGPGDGGGGPGDDPVALPEAVDVFADRSANRAWYTVAVTHRALHAAAGTFALAWATPPALFPPLVDVLDVPAGSSDLWAFFGLFDDRRLAVDLFAVIEDLRVDALIARDYPGLREPLRRVQARWLDGRPPLHTLPLRSAVVELVVRYSVADWDAQAPAACAPPATVLRDVLRPLEDPRATVRDTAEATLRVYSLVTALPQVTIDQSPGPIARREPDRVQVRAKTHASAPAHHRTDAGWLAAGSPPVWPREWPEPPRPRLEGSQALAADVPRVDYRDRLVAALAGRRPTPASGDQGVYDIQERWERADGPVERAPGPGDDPRPAEPEPAPVSEPTLESQHRHHSHWTDFADPSPAPIPDGPLVLRGDPGERLYPEFDAVAQRLRPDWCIVRERPPAPASSSDAHRLALRTFGWQLPALRRELEQLAPEALRLVRRTEDGQDVDLDAAVEALVDIRVGTDPSRRVYSASRRLRRDVAVALLLDLSASTSEHVKGRDGAAAARATGRRIIDVERVGVALLLESLRSTGDRAGVFGFSSSGRDRVDVLAVKDFDEPVSAAVWRRIDGMKPLQGTRMGAAVRHVTHRLSSLRSATKLLVVVSDGRPHDRGYGSEYEHAGRAVDYAVGDTRHAFESARAAGVRPFLLTVDAAGHEYLAQACGDMPYEVLADAAALPARLLSLYRSMVTSAAGRPPARTARPSRP